MSNQVETTSPPASSARKPNPRALSSTDCHTCALLSRRCDRQRPRCSTCTTRNEKCGGFATPLSWDRGWTWLGQPPKKKTQAQTEPQCQSQSHVEPEGATQTTPTSKKNAARKSAKNEAEAQQTTLDGSVSSSARQFRFVKGRPAKRRKRSVSEEKGIGGDNNASNSIDVQAERPESRSDVEHAQQQHDVPEDAGLGFHTDNGDNILRSDMCHMFNSIPEDSDSSNILQGNTAELSPFLAESYSTTQDDAFAFENQLFDIGSFDTSVPKAYSLLDYNQDISNLLMTDLNYSEVPITAGGTSKSLDIHLVDFMAPMPTTSNNMQPKFEDLLELYDQVYCVLPLTSDVKLNPFRCREENTNRSRLLMHAILALCYRHKDQNKGEWSSQAHQHKSTAMHLLQDATKDAQANTMGLAILDPILIMFTLDCASSAYGAWTTQLIRSYNVLQACGGPSSLKTPRVRLQVGMLIWWDATLALISRDGLVIPNEYLEYVLDSTTRDVWCFYDLGGCPQGLFVHLARLAHLARENEVAASMEWVQFNLAPVRKIETAIKDWQCPRFRDASIDDSDKDQGTDGAEQYQFQQDLYHCAEAWRLSLLIYIERVFKWDRNTKAPAIIEKLARKTLDHIRCCRRTSLIQKQLLLPVFLAGSESLDEDAREMVRNFCGWWTEKSRYEMFHTVSVLLEDLWQDTSPNAWWGSNIDKKTKPVLPGQTPMYFLLG